MSRSDRLGLRLRLRVRFGLGLGLRLGLGKEKLEREKSGSERKERKEKRERQKRRNRENPSSRITRKYSACVWCLRLRVRIRVRVTVSDLEDKIRVEFRHAHLVKAAAITDKENYFLNISARKGERGLKVGGDLGGEVKELV
eukprot:1323675-Amorphochlora_amoeboformis.AAC.1